MSFIWYVNILIQFLISVNRVGSVTVKSGPGQVSTGTNEGNWTGEVPPLSAGENCRQLWDKGQELDEGGENKKHRRDQAVTQGWSLWFGS